jgi:hypothetical protein
VTKEQLLAEIEDLLRSMPPRATLRHQTQENLSWLGRAADAIDAWKSTNMDEFRRHLDRFHSVYARDSEEGFRGLMVMLNQARHDLRMQTIGPVNVALSQGMVFDYFDEIRKIIEAARQDLLFVDPYLDAEFVSRYLSQVASGVTIRLLAREKLPTLLPAVDVWVRQSGAKVEVRSINGFHDRYMFVDHGACYQSGASFKDGAKSAPTTLTQITDAFPAVLKIYEDLWNTAKVER